MKSEIRIGTSGWHYDHWKKKFYPEKAPKTKWLEYYVTKFDTVELNNTFYRLPTEKMMKTWEAQAPDDFIYTVKCSRFITHIKRLNDPKDALKNFFDIVKLLKNHLGPILYQLPQSFKKDIDKLNSFLKVIPKKFKSVFEFRHDSWYDNETIKMLNDYGVGFCIHDWGGKHTPNEVCGKMIYLRFHGASGKYQGNYPDSVLKDWAKWIKENQSRATDIYAYFNNDIGAYAPNNALTLKSFLE